MRRTVGLRPLPATPWILLLAGLLAGGCGGGGSTPTPPATPAPAPPLGEPFGFTDLADGAGPPAEDGWLVAIAYTGWLYEPSASDNRGSEFASQDQLAFRLGVGQVIGGVDQGVLGMRVGGRRRIVVPPELGFGAGGNELVPGNATLLFEVELLAAAETPFETTDLVVGSGEEAANGSQLSMAYEGWVFDLLAPENKGSPFDATTSDDPFVFTLGVGAVITGWDLGIPGMRVGGRRRIVIPHDLAYGAAGRPPRIPSYATLLFEVELLAIN